VRAAPSRRWIANPNPNRNRNPNPGPNPNPDPNPNPNPNPDPDPDPDPNPNPNPNPNPHQVDPSKLAVPVLQGKLRSKLGQNAALPKKKDELVKLYKKTFA